MRKKLRFFVRIAAALCAALAGMTACAAEAEEERITLRFMHFYGDGDTDLSGQYMREFLETEFPEVFPNVDLVQEIYDNQTYKSKIKVVMAAEEAPDIMFGYGAGFSENFVKAGMILPLDDYLNDFYKEHIDMELQENFIYDDQLYGICFSHWNGVLYCNQALFDEIGAEIPQTYEELIEVSRQFREAGIEPVACGMTNKWHGQQWVNNFTIQLGGADLYNQMARGEMTMDNKVLAQAAQLTADLVEAGVFCSSMLSISSSEAEDMFLNGESAMIYVGSWYTELAEEKLGEDLVVAKMPVVPGAVDTNDYHGGAINGWMVSADTEYPELAAEIVAWIGYRLSCYQPDSVTFEIEPEDQVYEITPKKAEVMALFEDQEEGGVAWDTLLRSDYVDTWLNQCASLFEGTTDAKGFAEALGRQLW